METPGKIGGWKTRQAFPIGFRPIFRGELLNFGGGGVVPRRLLLQHNKTPFRTIFPNDTFLHGLRLQGAFVEKCCLRCVQNTGISSSAG